MATTTNYGWTTPDDTALVKDGASAIRTLGSAVDSSMAKLRGGTTGQVLKKASATQMDFEWGAASGALTLVNKTTFSAVSSVTVDSIFSSTYDTYLIDVIFTANTSTTTVNMNLRSSAPADLSATNVYRTQTTTLKDTLASSQTVSTTVWPVSLTAGSADRQNNRITIVMSKLAAAEFKHGYSIGNTQDGEGDAEGTLRFFNYAGATAAAGLKLAMSSGTFTGQIVTYGYGL